MEMFSELVLHLQGGSVMVGRFLKKGDAVVVLSNCVCYAPVETIGETGIVVEVLDSGLYKGKVDVMFLEPIEGYVNWLYDESEIEELGNLDISHTRSTYSS